MKAFKLIAVLVLIGTSAIAQKGLQVGQKAPSFTAKGQSGSTVDLAKVLKKGPAVVIFYRGNWCPNCSRELKNLQDSLQLITAKGVTVIAVSPETAEGVAKTVLKAAATFHVISDNDLAITKSYDVLIPISADMDAIHKQYGINVPGNNGPNGNYLPRPAAFIIQPNGIVSFAYFNSSPYTDPHSNQRISVAELIANLTR